MAKRNSQSNSSMPNNPPMKGRRWSKKLVDKIVGRWVLVGWIDSPADAGICVANQFEGVGQMVSEPMVFFPKKGYCLPIDSPNQVIDISFKVVNDNPYRITKNGWSVVG